MGAKPRVDKTTVIKAYLDGTSLEDICLTQQASMVHIRSILRQAGYTDLPGKKRSEATRRSYMAGEIWKMYNMGYETATIAKNLGVSMGHVRQIARNMFTDLTPQGLPFPLAMGPSMIQVVQHCKLASKHCLYSVKVAPGLGTVQGRRYNIHQWIDINPDKDLYYLAVRDTVTKECYIVPEDYFNWDLPDWEQSPAARGRPPASAPY